MDLMEEIKFYVKDEEDANKTYSRMANDADDAGMHDTARILRGMAADELRHKEMLEGIHYRPEFGPVRERRSIVESRVFQEAAGLRPRRPITLWTYGDWVDLAEDIKARDSNPETWDRVNDSLSIIAGSIEGDVDDAKRWLVDKAGKLGIR